jgi:hypothetical protein
VEQNKSNIKEEEDETTLCTYDIDLDTMNQKMRFWLTVSGFISIAFLLLTLLFYLTLPDLCNFQV